MRTISRSCSKISLALFLLISLCTSLAQAQPTGAIRELVERRTATSKHWQNADGSVTSEVFSGPIHYKDTDGAWKDIDTTIGDSARTGFACAVLKNPVKVHFSGNAAGWQAMETDEGMFLLAARGAVSPGRRTADRRSIIYSDVWPSVDLKYQVIPTGIKEDIILRQQPATAASFQFVANTGGLQPSKSSDGGIDFLDASGNVRVEMPAPFMIDAEGRFSPAVTLDSKSNKDGTIAITLSPDQEWLATAAYPVTIDPTTVTIDQYTRDGDDNLRITDAYVNHVEGQTSATWNYTATVLPMGYGGGYSQHACIKFDTTGIPSTAIVSAARIELKPYSVAGGHYVEMRRITAPWVTGQFPTLESSYLASVSLPTTGTQTFSNDAIKAVVQDWIWNSSTNYGAEWHSPEYETTSGYYLGVTDCSSESAGNGPKLIVTYSMDTTAPNPGVATSPAYSDTASVTVDYDGATDNDGKGLEKVELWYKLAYWGTWTNSNLSSTTDHGSFSFTCPEGEGTYYFDLVAEDKAGNRSATPTALGDDSTIYDSMTPGTDRAYVEGEYLYPGGPLMTARFYDETSYLIKESVMTYGPECELLSQSLNGHPLGSATYDALYRPLTVSDGKGQTTTYNYDSDTDKVGNLVSITYPGDGVVQFTEYDPAGHLLEQIDPNQVITTFVYDDPEDLLTDINITYQNQQISSRHFTYDNAYGRLLTATDKEGSVTYGYTSEGILQSVTRSYITGQDTYIDAAISYDYWPDGSLKTIDTPAGDFSYTYDVLGRPAGLTNPAGQVFSWDYWNDGSLRSQQARTGSIGNTLAKSTYVYNQRGFLTALINEGSNGSNLSQYDGCPRIAYDATGNELGVYASIPAAPSFSGQTSYSYDEKDQLVSESSDRGGGYGYSFDYDNAGNPTTFRNTEYSDGSYNSNNQRTRLLNNQIVGFTFDSNGNPTGYRSGIGLGYDSNDNLTSFSAALGTVQESGYDGSGKRAWKLASGSKSYYLYSGDVPVCEMDANGNITAVNTFGPNGLLSRSQGPSESSIDYIYTYDPQGNVVQVIDSDAQIVATMAYDAYGNPLNGSSTNPTPYGYGGQAGYYTDSETGLILATYRYYDPQEGRWINRDPIGYAGGMNLYRYCGNNPVNYLDPLGLYSWADFAWDINHAGLIAHYLIPDYYVLGGGFWGYGQVAIDRYGRIYVGIGGSLSYLNFASLHAGYVDYAAPCVSNMSNREQLFQFLRGNGTTVGGGFVIGGGMTYGGDYKNFKRGWGREVGFDFPGGGVTHTYSFTARDYNNVKKYGIKGIFGRPM